MHHKASISSVKELGDVVIYPGIHGKDKSSSDSSYDLETGSLDNHCHSTVVANNNKNRRAEKVLWIAVVLASIFIAIELTGGIIGGSLAVMTDACHMTSDLLSFFLSIIALRIARRPASKNLSFGYERAEILGALVSIIILWILTGMLIVLAVVHIRANKMDVNADVMLITASCGVIFNIIMGLVMHFGSSGGGDHGHGHGHSHGGGHGQNMNLRAALIHVLGDLMQSISVLGAALIIKFTGWMLADPLCTFLFAIIVMCTTGRVAKDIVYVLMEANPHHLDPVVIREELSAIEGVVTIHDLHLWSLNTSTTAIAVHLSIDEKHDSMDVLRLARELVTTKHKIALVTIQVERFESHMTTCGRCTANSQSK